MSILVDGHWGTWGEFGKCSGKCGTGHRVKNRPCNNPAPKNGGKACVGNGTAVEPCTLPNPCPGKYFSNIYNN